MTGDASLHVWGNGLEAGLWVLVGLVFLVQVVRLRADRAKRNRCLIAAVAFWVFGLSDVIEMQTGAWWRPWWLFAMKAGCVAVFLWLGVDHYRRRNRGAAS